MTIHRGVKAAAIVVVLAASLGACARPTGDFGRAAPSVMHDQIMPAVGASQARARGEPVSNFNQTDQEREMHDRVWRFLIAPHARDWFYDTAVELQRTRLTGATDISFNPDRYYNHLRSSAFASSRIRYRAVGNDIDMDLATIPATFIAICNVIEVDRQRGIAVSNVGTPENAQQAAARKWENDQKIAWFTRALDYRYQAYSMALDRLLVETPHEEARIVDEKLAALSHYVRRAKARDFCGGGSGAIVSKNAPIPSRIESGPVYRK